MSEWIRCSSVDDNAGDIWINLSNASRIEWHQTYSRVWFSASEGDYCDVRVTPMDLIDRGARSKQAETSSYYSS